MTDLHKSWFSGAPLCAAALVLSACAGDISPSAALGDDDQQACSAISISALEDKSAFLVEANASDDDAWVYFDMDNAEEVSENDSTKVWDLAFRRFLVRSNGGEGGPDTVAVAFTQGSGASFDSVAQPADDGSTDGSGQFRQDGPDPDPEGGNNDGNGHVLNSYPVDPDHGLSEAVVDGWPVYDDQSHRLSPRPETIFTVRSSAGAYYKVEFLGYYSSAHGGAGYPQFKYANHASGWSTDEIALGASGCGDDVVIPTVEVEQDDEIYTVQVNASAEDSWIYLNLGGLDQRVYANDDEAALSLDWDIAFKRTDIMLNGGSSGPGAAGAHDLLNGTFGERTEPPAEGGVEIPQGVLLPIPTTVVYHQDGRGLAMTSQPPRSAGDDDGDLLGDFGWYNYAGFSSGFLDHTIRPRSATYVVRAADGQTYYEVEFFQYYLTLDEQEIAGYIAFRMRVL